MQPNLGQLLAGPGRILGSILSLKAKFHYAILLDWFASMSATKSQTRSATCRV